MVIYQQRLNEFLMQGEAIPDTGFPSSWIALVFALASIGFLPIIYHITVQVLINVQVVNNTFQLHIFCFILPRTCILISLINVKSHRMILKKKRIHPPRLLFFFLLILHSINVIFSLHGYQRDESRWIFSEKDLLPEQLNLQECRKNGLSKIKLLP